jgi:hypothetical protein
MVTPRFATQQSPLWKAIGGQDDRDRDRRTERAAAIA